MDRKVAALNGLLRLVSPIGANEYVDTSGEYVPRSAVAISRGDNIYYRPHVKNDATTQEHERIHVGQHRLEKNLPIETLRRIFSQGYEKELRADGKPPADRTVLFELPAYGISGTNMPFDWKDYTEKEKVQASALLQKAQFSQTAKYLNELKRQNSGDRGIATIEAALAEQFLRKLIKENPPPIRNPKVPGLWGK